MKHEDRVELTNKIVAMLEAGYTCAEIAKTFGVNESTVRAVAKVRLNKES